jgi:hypothetical protein
MQWESGRKYSQTLLYQYFSWSTYRCGSDDTETIVFVRHGKTPMPGSDNLVVRA